jgi:hypothetical protein
MFGPVEAKLRRRFAVPSAGVLNRWEEPNSLANLYDWSAPQGRLESPTQNSGFPIDSRHPAMGNQLCPVHAGSAGGPKAEGTERWLSADVYGGDQEGAAAVTRAKAFRWFLADMKS